MSMQLRWFTVGHKPPVLQWRHYHGSHFKDNRRGADEGWSDWTDVPVAQGCPTCGQPKPCGDNSK